MKKRMEELKSFEEKRYDYLNLGVIDSIKQEVSLMRSRAAIFLVCMGILLFFPQWSDAQWVKTYGPKCCTISVLAANGTNLFADTKVHGIFRSTYNGTSWTAVNSGLPEKTMVRCLAVSGTNVFAGTDEGVWRLPLSSLSIEK